MDDSETLSLEQIQEFLATGKGIRLRAVQRIEVYDWVERTLVRMEYGGRRRRVKGLIRQYVARLTGLSRAQVTRLIADYQRTGQVTVAPYQRTRFARVYT